MRYALLSCAVVFGLLGACADPDDPGAHAGHTSSDEEYTFGEAADPGQAHRTIEVSATDSLDFSPDEIDAQSGETITFVVTNEGSEEHEFTIGDEAYHESYGTEGGPTHHGSNGVHLPPGETHEFTWAFSGAGKLLFACHVNGHYIGGMVGSINLSFGE